MTVPAVAAQAPPQVDVLELPSATTMRFVLLTAGMLVTGLFVGVSVFNAVEGRSFAAAVIACSGSAAVAGVTAVSSGDTAFAAGPCLAPFEHLYALYAMAGAVAVVCGAAVVIMVAPAVLTRRHRLRDPGPVATAARARVAAFCADVGIRHPPRLLVGSTNLRDAFCLGRPGRYAVAVPLLLVVRPHTPQFEAVLRHELAHVRHHDVALAWLARSVGYALAPLLLVPVVLFPLTGDLATLPDYLWRAAALAVVVALAACSALRSRELSADAAAARRAGPEALGDALAGVGQAATASWRRILAVHPARDDRIAAVGQLGRTAVVTMTDGAVVGFLTALALPMLDLFFTAVFAGVDAPDVPFVVASAVVLGPLAGATLGLGFWRQAVVARNGAVQARVAPVLAGVAVGAVAGQIGSVAGVGLTGAGLTHPILVLVVAAALTGAAGTTAGSGELWADALGRRFGRRTTALAATGVAILVFTIAIWAGDVVQGLLDLAGWSGVSVDLPVGLTPLPLSLVAILLAASLAWALGPARVPQTPALGPTLATGVGAGLAAAAVIVLNRVRLGDAPDDAENVQRLIGNWWIAAGGAAAAGAVLALTCGRRGRGAGLLAGIVAALVAAIGNLGLLAGINGALPLGTITGVVTKDLALGLLVSLPVAGLLPSRGTPLRARSSTLLVVCAAMLAAGAGSAAAAGRDVLAIPVPSDTQPVQPAPPGPPPEAPPLTTADYKMIAGILAGQRAAIQTEMDAVGQESSAEDRIAQIDDRLIPDLQRLLTQAEGIRPADPAAVDLHRHLLTSLRLTIAAYRDVATGLRRDDAALARSRTELTTEAQELTTWMDGVPRL